MRSLCHIFQKGIAAGDAFLDCRDLKGYVAIIFKGDLSKGTEFF